MTSHKAPGAGRLGQTLAGFCILAMTAALLAAGCGSSTSVGSSIPFPTPKPTATPGVGSSVSATATPAGPTSVASGSPTLSSDIPPGHSFAEGGGGPLSYTFREEWRRARAAAWAWRSGAYLVEASGNYVNDQGEPNSWALNFISSANPDAAFRVEIDPWGKVTATHVVTGDAVSSLIGPYSKAIPYSIIDSDTAVGIGKTALAASFNLANTNTPSLGLRFSELDGSGPYWTYSLF